VTDECVQIVTTCDDQPLLEQIARTLVEQRLVACAQISGPLSSHYRWRGELHATQEWLCTAKTTRRRAADVVAAIQRLHRYEQPEILVTPIIGGSAEYLRWVNEETAESV
jgi:periplasmic divalent cation tolerance protein